MIICLILIIVGLNEEFVQSQYESYEDYEEFRIDTKNNSKGPVSIIIAWPFGIIPYKYAGKFDANEKKEIESAMGEFAKHTCVYFDTIMEVDDDYILITDIDGKGCSTPASGFKGGVQPVNLEKGKCTTKKAVIDVLMQVIGFPVETRQVDESKFKKREKKKGNNPGFDYDNRSMMRFSKYEYYDEDESESKEETELELKDKQTFDKDESTGLSEDDIKKIHRKYACQP